MTISLLKQECRSAYWTARFWGRQGAIQLWGNTRQGRLKPGHSPPAGQGARCLLDRVWASIQARSNAVPLLYWLGVRAGSTPSPRGLVISFTDQPTQQRNGRLPDGACPWVIDVRQSVTLPP